MTQTPYVPKVPQHHLGTELETTFPGDLLGLANRDNRELTERKVRNRYLVGALVRHSGTAAVAGTVFDEPEHRDRFTICEASPTERTANKFVKQEGSLFGREGGE